VQYSHSKWYVEYLIENFGEEEAEAALAADNAVPNVCCVVNTAKANREDVIDSLLSEGAIVAPRKDSDVLFTIRSSGSIAKYKSFKKGEFYVQDAGAYKIAELCGVKAGDVIIDLCAAPGGKSFALANLSEGKGRILAFDLPQRVELIKEGITRLGLSNIIVRAGDATIVKTQLKEMADVVLVDAPCSGFGVIRKKPEIRFKSLESVQTLPVTQLKILEAASVYVKPGGTLVYSTCTTLKKENDGVADAFLQQHTDFSETDRQTTLPSLDSDGFFASVMTRK